MMLCTVRELILTICVALFASVAPAFAQDAKQFYRGGLDDKVTTAPNGAKLNAAFMKVLEATWGKTQIVNPLNGVHVIVGYQIANLTVIEGKTGLILFDAGSSIGQGQELLKLIRTFSDKAVAAVIYGHHHYTGGAKVFVEAGKDVKVYGHPDVDANLAKTSGPLGPMQMRRIGIQLGAYLSDKGADGSFSLPEPHFKEAALNADAGAAPGREARLDQAARARVIATADVRADRRGAARIVH